MAATKKKLKVRTKAGEVVDYSVGTVKRVLKDAGYTGAMLTKAVNSTFKEAKGLAKEGVVTAARLEKAIVKAMNNTNKAAMNSAERIARRVFK